ncbi:hypothetical protein ACFJIV_28965 [Mucilaginibacter sp. UC70_90]
MPTDNNISPQRVLDLAIAFRDAGKDYKEVLQRQDVRHLDTVMGQLPDYMGKFLSSLNLLNEFTRIGILIRGFEDAFQVMIKLTVLINDKLEQGQPEDTKRYMDLLFGLCDETSRINAAFTIAPKMSYPEDFMPGHPFSDN